MVGGTEILMLDEKGREIIRTIKRKKYTINFIKQDNSEKNLDSLYKLAAELLYEEALMTKERKN